MFSPRSVSAAGPAQSPRVKLGSAAPANPTDDDLLFFKQLGVDCVFCAVTPELNVIGAYYGYFQPTFGAPTNCAAGPTPANCSGTLDAFSFAVDWQFAKKFDAYAGLMYSQVNGGQASGYLKHNNVDPTVGMRFRF